MASLEIHFLARLLFGESEVCAYGLGAGFAFHVGDAGVDCHKIPAFSLTRARMMIWSSVVITGLR